MAGLGRFFSKSKLKKDVANICGRRRHFARKKTDRVFLKNYDPFSFLLGKMGAQKPF